MACPRASGEPSRSGEIELNGVGDRPRTEDRTVAGARASRAAQHLGEGRGRVDIGEIGAAGHHLDITIGPAEQAVLHFVEIRELPAAGVDLPVIGIASQDQDVVRTIVGHHPGTHHRKVHPAGGKGQLVGLVAAARVVARMEQAQHVSRTGTELPVGHLVKIVAREGALEGPADGVGAERLEPGARPEAVGRGSVERTDVGI